MVAATGGFGTEEGGHGPMQRVIGRPAVRTRLTALATENQETADHDRNCDQRDERRYHGPGMPHIEMGGDAVDALRRAANNADDQQ